MDWKNKRNPWVSERSSSPLDLDVAPSSHIWGFVITVWICLILNKERANIVSMNNNNKLVESFGQFQRYECKQVTKT